MIRLSAMLVVTGLALVVLGFIQISREFTSAPSAPGDGAGSAGSTEVNVQIFSEPGTWTNPWPDVDTVVEVRTEGDGGTYSYRWPGALLPRELPVAPGSFGDIAHVMGRGTLTVVSTWEVSRASLERMGVTSEPPR